MFFKSLLYIHFKYEIVLKLYKNLWSDLQRIDLTDE